MGGPVGQASKETRRSHPPPHCVWCGKIRVERTWTEERRESAEGSYADGLCPDCRGDYFMDSLARVDARRR